MLASHHNSAQRALSARHGRSLAPSGPSVDPFELGISFRLAADDFRHSVVGPPRSVAIPLMGVQRHNVNGMMASRITSDGFTNDSSLPTFVLSARAGIVKRDSVTNFERCHHYDNTSHAERTQPDAREAAR